MSMSVRGISSGLDIDGMIQQLVALEQRPIIQLQLRREDWNVEKDAWRDINTRLKNLQTTLSDLKLSSTFTKIKVTSADEEIVTATASSDATQGEYSIKVERLATKHREVSKQHDANYKNTSEDITDFDFSEKNATITIGNTAVTLNQDYGDLTTMAAALDFSAEGVNVSVEGSNLVFSNTSDFVVKTDGDGVSKLTGVAGDAESYFTSASSFDIRQTVDGAEQLFTVNVQAGDTLVETMKTINELDADVKATIVDERLLLESTVEGVDGQFQIENDTASIMAGGWIDAAVNSKVAVNGIYTEAYGNTVDGFINGVTLNLVGEDSTKDMIISVGRDTEHTIEKIQAFVDQYNSTMGFLSQKMETTVQRDGAVRGAVLTGDGTALRLSNKLRAMISDKHADDGDVHKYLYSIGISTGESTASEEDVSVDEILALDTEKVTEALNEDPEAVRKLFYDSDNEACLVSQMQDYLKMYTEYGTGILSEKEKSIDATIKGINEQIERVEYRVEMKEKHLIRQFTAMESALSTMQNQATWLTGQLASLSSFNWSGNQGQ